MAQRLDILQCPDCGILFEQLRECECDCELKCGEQTLERLAPNTVDAAVEKHVPVIEKTDSGVKVTVGSTPHPMTEEHYIQWIEVIEGDRVCRVFLHPGDEPSAQFCWHGGGVRAREYCNLHGLWEATS